jgi:putative transferase (TIGR04331 family)
MNIPTVMFWNTNHWELREPAKTHFNNLIEVGVLHETPESAARHINMIWHDVNSWWNSEIIKEAIHKFKNFYCHTPNDLVGQIHLQLKNLIKK